MFKFLFIIATLACSYANAELVILSEGGFSSYTNLIAEFEAQTGEKVLIVDSNFGTNLQILDGSALPETVGLPNSVTPDLIFAKDLTYLAQAKAYGFTQSFDALPIFNKVKAGMVDLKDRHWVAVAYRARTLAYGINVDISSINTYEDLAKPEWAGRLCLRTSNNSYSYGLVSYLIEEYGQPKAKEILLGWMDNLAMPVHRGDGLLLQDLHTGVCEVGIINHYYLAREYYKAEGQGTKFNVKIKYLNQGKGGVHTNGYGVALLKSSKNKDLAQKFVEHFLSDKAQMEISTSKFNFPVIESLSPASLVKDWGTFETSPLDWADIGENLDAAAQLMKETDYE